MYECRPVSTPMESNKETYDNNSDEGTDFPYREIVGTLRYLSCKTRPDITYAVNFANRFIENPTHKDIVNVKRILRYLKGTQHIGIQFTLGDRILGYCDSDYAGSGPEGKMKSTTGYTVIYANGPITWCSRKQNVVATSTAEAEYISAAECCKELQYLSTLFRELTTTKPRIDLYIDNQSAIKLIQSGQMNKRSKHIDVWFYYISEAYHENKLFELHYCSTEEQVADIFTKPLLSTKFQKFRTLLCCEVPN